MPKTAGPATDQHQLTEVRHAVVDAPEAVFHSSVQGPVDFVRCACGWTVKAEDANIYTAVGEHLSDQL